ncbi:Hypothetical_protein [Hexamita inflata]|uniref:Hypothetical_protein n=1 Tax=Hexamita inflata TaxID=28002 RepID=A0AA86USZ5_9EUKA|nr:Hypothetical protein HINF_LOCUS36363 [Hexamita inflata]
MFLPIISTYWNKLYFFLEYLFVSFILLLTSSIICEKVYYCQLQNSTYILKCHRLIPKICATYCIINKQSDLQKSDIKQPGPKSLKAEELMQKIIQQHEQETSLKDTIIQSLKSNLQQNQTQIQALNTQIQDLKLLANSDQINRQKIYYEGLIQRLNDQIHAKENSLVTSQVEKTVQKLKISMQLK